MPARATASSTISFGLVSIPVKLYTATSSKSVHFNLLHAECGTRVKQQLYCPTHDETVDRSETVKGYEISRGQYVTFTSEELKQLEAERTNTIDIVEFVEANEVDFIQIDKTYYLGPDRGGHKAYNLLSASMRDTRMVAIGRYSARGKSHVVMLRPYDKGIALHQLFYAGEVRSFDEVDVGEDQRFAEAELDMARQLITQLQSETFDPSRYRDDYSDRVREVAEQKAAGEEITTAPEQPAAQIVDLFDALKRSLEPGEQEGKKKAKEGPKGPKKRSPKAPDKKKRGAAS